MKAEKIAKAEKLEKEAWLEKMERQEKLQQGGMRAMDPLEAHMLSKITAGVTMIMSSKRKELMADEVRASFNMGIIHRESVNMSVFGLYKKNGTKVYFSAHVYVLCVFITLVQCEFLCRLGLCTVRLSLPTLRWTCRQEEEEEEL